MTVMTSGIHHIGLTVSKLEESANFFVQQLGWREIKRKPDYPAIFVSDGNIMLTLWATQVPSPTGFDRKSNVGLHHIALVVKTEAELLSLHQQLLQSGVEIEFSPEHVGESPAKHMMCYDPSGVRIEFFWAGA